MICRDVATFLAEYVTGELPDHVRVDFESHLTKCSNCGVFLEQYRATIRAGAAAFDEPDPGPLPEALVAAILASIEKR